jgi:hypothetical protein
LEVAFGGNLLCEPWMQEVIGRAECDGTRTYDRDHFLYLYYTGEKLLPKEFVQFSDHQPRGGLGKAC